MAGLPVLPSGSGTPSALRTVLLSPLDGWPTHTPADASPRPSRADTHGSGPMWVATPSSRRTCTSYLPPVSRRTPELFAEVSDAAGIGRSRTCRTVAPDGASV